MPWLAGVSVISEGERATIRENLLFGLQQFEIGLDKAITASGKRHAEAEIWSLIDDDDNGFLVDLMLQAGMRVPAAAYAVRALANSAWQFRLGNILLPRFMDTWNHYAAQGGLGLGFGR